MGKGVFIVLFANKRKTQMFEVTEELGRERALVGGAETPLAPGGLETPAEGNAFAAGTRRAERLSGHVLGLGPGDGGS